MLNRLRAKVARDYIANLHAIAATRIESGDMDFDDWVFRTEEAARTLLDLWFDNKESK